MKFIVLTSPTKIPCGVEAFARQLEQTLSKNADTPAVQLPVEGTRGDLARMWQGFRGADTLLLNLPVVAWKKHLGLPLLALLFARLRRLHTVVVLHEWQDLNWARRGTYFLYLLLVETVICSSPTVQSEFRQSLSARLIRFKLSLVPIPPNLRRTLPLTETPLSQKLAALRAQGRTIIGHFGSIYPRKQSIVILDLVAKLRARNIDAFLVFIGSFIKGSDHLEQDFRARIHQLGLDDHVAVSGYVGTDAEIFGLFEQVDAFAYIFAEGLTARRGSVLATLQSGRPVFVNAPTNADEFDHHPSYQRLLASGTLKLMPHDADIAAYVEAIAACDFTATGTCDVNFDLAWQDAAAAVLDAARTPSLASRLHLSLFGHPAKKRLKSRQMPR